MPGPLISDQPRQQQPATPGDRDLNLTVSSFSHEESGDVVTRKVRAPAARPFSFPSRGANSSSSTMMSVTNRSVMRALRDQESSVARPPRLDLHAACNRVSLPDCTERLFAAPFQDMTSLRPCQDKKRI